MQHTYRALLQAAGTGSILFLPILAFAATEPANSGGIDVLGEFLLQFVYLIDNYLVPLLFAIAFLMFLWGVYLYFIQGAANEEKRTLGRQFVVWGIIGLFIMISIWGIINLLLNSFELDSQSRPPLPTFESGQSTGNTSDNAALFPSADKDPSKKTTDTTTSKTGTQEKIIN